MGCCKTTFVITLLAIVGAIAAIVALQIDMNIVLMRFFRDVARAKARKRLYGNDYAVMPLFLKTEEAIPLKTADDLSAEEYMTLTAEELLDYDGFDDGPLYVGIKGRVYDVTANQHFYGEDGKYHLFVGKDSTHAFATGCLDDTPECVNPSMEGLSEADHKEIDRWVELYETHDMYKFVGFIVDDPVNAILEADELEDEEYDNDDEGDKENDDQQEEIEYV